MEFYGVLTFKNALLCQKEVLGEVFNAIIADVNVKICFPCYPKDTTQEKCVGIENPLEPPKGNHNFTRGGKAWDWGSPMDYPAGNSIVKAVVFFIECKEEKIEENARKLYSSIKCWGKKFVDYCDLCVRKTSASMHYIEPNVCDLELIYKKYIPSNQPIRIELSFINESQCLTKNQVSNALDFASSKEELLLEYQMLLSAYKANEGKQNRQAIVDACSAVEICLNKQISEYCKRIGIDRSILTDKYRYLSDKFNLSSKIDSNFPKYDYKSSVVELRNAVVHSKSTNPSAKETNTLISIIEKVLAHYHKDYY